MRIASQRRCRRSAADCARLQTETASRGMSEWPGANGSRPGSEQRVSLVASALRLNYRRFGNAGPDDALAERRLLRGAVFRDRHGFPCPRRLVERLNDPNVLQPVCAGRLWLSILQNAIGEVQQLGRKLIALADANARRLAVDGQR